MAAGSGSSCAGGGCRRWWTWSSPSRVGRDWRSVVLATCAEHRNPAAWVRGWWLWPSIPPRSASPRWNGRSRSATSWLPKAGEVRGLGGPGAGIRLARSGCCCAGFLGRLERCLPLNKPFLRTGGSMSGRGAAVVVPTVMEPVDLDLLGLDLAGMARATLVAKHATRSRTSARYANSETRYPWLTWVAPTPASTSNLALFC